MIAVQWNGGLAAMAVVPMPLFWRHAPCKTQCLRLGGRVFSHSSFCSLKQGTLS
jgi:hypothetical protein